MSEKKHTPGPWWMAGDKPGEQTPINPVVRGFKDGTRRITICRTGHGDHADYEFANARLVSAAPELLEALQEAKAALEWCVEQGGGPACEHESGGVVCFCKENKALSSARAAIAKATGGQP